MNLFTICGFTKTQRMIYLALTAVRLKKTKVYFDKRLLKKVRTKTQKHGLATGKVGLLERRKIG